jgi:hypothetical protein
MMAKTIEEPLDERVRRMAKDFPFNGYVNVRAIEFAHLLDTRDKHIRALEAENKRLRDALRGAWTEMREQGNRDNWTTIPQSYVDAMNEIQNQYFTGLLDQDNA